MEKFISYPKTRGELDTFEYEFEYRFQFDESLADRTSFRPTVENINALDAMRGNVEEGVFHFPDGRDDGRGLDTVPRRGEDIAVLYQRTREMEMELNQKIADAKELKRLGEEFKRNNAALSVPPAAESASGTGE